MVVGNTSTTGRSYLSVTLDDVPDELLSIRAGLRSVAPAEPITAELVLREDGGCERSDEVAGKIAVLPLVSANGQLVGNCGFDVRAATMAAGGAKAVLLLLMDRPEDTGTGGESPFPVVTLGSTFGEPLLSWMIEGNTTVATIDNAFTRDYLAEPDLLSPSSSRGPGLNWAIKPDISAPGTGVVSSVLVTDSSVPNEPTYTSTWPAFSGTSMAAPHITGAAGLLRSIHPEWTVPQLRSALINTSIPIVNITGSLTEPVPATPNQSGPGRVELVGAADPGALFFPPKASFGAIGEDEQHEIEIRVDSASEEDIIWDVAVEPMAGRATVSAGPESLAIAAGGSTSLTISLDSSTAVTDTEHWGYVVLTERLEPEVIFLPALVSAGALGGDEAGGGIVAVPDPDRAEGLDQSQSSAKKSARTLRVVYYAYIDIEANREDVLVVNWTYGDTPDHTSFYTEALDEAGLGYDVFNMGEAADHPEGPESMHPTFEDMYRHDLVILNANESRVSLQSALRGQFQYQNYMLSGGNFLIAGQGNQGWWRYLDGALPDIPAVRKAFTDTWPMQWMGASQNVGCEMCLARYFAGYTPELTATLSSRLLVPYPMAPDMPEMEVVLAPHPEADGPFDYPLDISTGGMAKDGALGNQYTFNSGSVVTGYRSAVDDDPATEVFEDQLAANLGDDGASELVIDRIVPIARPLWSYEVVSGTTKTVGTYVAGKHDPESGVAWNAMYWGFGLEGVGENGEGSASRAKLIGDTFNFMARNMEPGGDIVVEPDGSQRLEISLGKSAQDIRFVGAQIDWGDGTVEDITFDKPTSASKLKLQHKPHTGNALRKPVKVRLMPEPGTAAPVHLTLR
jgi:hypothetical protein